MAEVFWATFFGPDHCTLEFETRVWSVWCENTEIWKTSVFGEPGTYFRDLWWFVGLSSFMICLSTIIILVKRTGISQHPLIRNNIQWIRANSQFVNKAVNKMLIGTFIGLVTLRSISHYNELSKLNVSLLDVLSSDAECAIEYFEGAILCGIIPICCVLKRIKLYKVAKVLSFVLATVYLYRASYRAFMVSSGSVKQPWWIVWVMIIVSWLLYILSIGTTLVAFDELGCRALVNSVLPILVHVIKQGASHTLRFADALLSQCIAPCAKTVYRKVGPPILRIVQYGVQCIRQGLMLIRTTAHVVFERLVRPSYHVLVILSEWCHRYGTILVKNILEPGWYLLKYITCKAYSVATGVVNTVVEFCIQYPYRYIKQIVVVITNKTCSVTQSAWRSWCIPIYNRIVEIAKYTMRNSQSIYRYTMIRLSAIVAKAAYLINSAASKTWRIVVLPCLRIGVRVVRTWTLSFIVAWLSSWYLKFAVESNTARFDSILCGVSGSLYAVAAILLLGRAGRLSSSPTGRCITIATSIEKLGETLHSWYGIFIVYSYNGFVAICSGASTQIANFSHELLQLPLFVAIRSFLVQVTSRCFVIAQEMPMLLFDVVGKGLKRMWRDPWFILIAALFAQIPAMYLYQHREVVTMQYDQLVSIALSAVSLVVNNFSNTSASIVDVSVKWSDDATSFISSPFQYQLQSRTILVSVIVAHSFSAAFLERAQQRHSSSRDIQLDVRAMILRTLIKGFLGAVVVANLVQGMLWQALSRWSSVVAIMCALGYCTQGVSLSLSRFAMLRRTPRTRQTSRMGTPKLLPKREGNKNKTSSIKFYPSRKFREVDCVICLEALSPLHQPTQLGGEQPTEGVLVKGSGSTAVVTCPEATQFGFHIREHHPEQPFSTIRPSPTFPTQNIHGTSDSNRSRSDTVDSNEDDSDSDIGYEVVGHSEVPPIAEDNVIIKSGYLLKNIKIAGLTFRKQYFVTLRRGLLAIYSGKTVFQNGSKPRKTYDLHESIVEIQGDMFRLGVYNLDGIRTYREFYCVASESFTSLDWLAKLIQAGVAYNNAGSSSAATSQIRDSVAATTTNHAGESVIATTNQIRDRVAATTTNHARESVVATTNQIRDRVAATTTQDANQQHELQQPEECEEHRIEHNGNYVSEAVLSCGHCFHQECIETWLERSCHCPTCREPARSFDVALQVLFH